VPFIFVLRKKAFWDKLLVVASNFAKNVVFVQKVS